jgi:hypothetical protein
MAVMAGLKVLDQHESHSRLGGKAFQEPAESFQAPGRSPDADHRYILRIRDGEGFGIGAFVFHVFAPMYGKGFGTKWTDWTLVKIALCQAPLTVNTWIALFGSCQALRRPGSRPDL